MLKMSQNAPERRYATTLLTDTAVFYEFVKKCCRQVRLLSSKMYQNAFAAADSPRTPLAELTAFPRPPSWFPGAALRRGNGGEGKGRGGNGGIARLPFLLV